MMNVDDVVGFSTHEGMIDNAPVKLSIKERMFDRQELRAFLKPPHGWEKIFGKILMAKPNRTVREIE